MSLRRFSNPSVDRKDILGTSGKSNDQIHLCLKQDITSWSRNRFFPGKFSVGSPWDVHEKVQRTWRFRFLKPKFLHSRAEIVGTVVMIFGAAQKSVSGIVARRHQRIMYSPRGIFLNSQDRPSLIAEKRLSYPGADTHKIRATVFHGHEFLQVVPAECPGIHDLLPMGIDDFNSLPCFCIGCFPASGWDGDDGCTHGFFEKRNGLVSKDR